MPLFSKEKKQFISATYWPEKSVHGVIVRTRGIGFEAVLLPAKGVDVILLQ